MRLLPILAAASIGLFTVAAVHAQGMTTKSQTGAGNPTGAQNMDTSNKGNPNEPSAGQTSGMSSKATKHHKKSKKHHAM